MTESSRLSQNQSEEVRQIFIHDWVQKCIDDTQSDEIAVTAGYGTGKSHGSVQWLIEVMRENPKCKYFAYTEPTHQLIERIAAPTWRDVLEQYGLIEGQHFFIITGKNPRIDFKIWNQRVNLVSMEKPESIVGFQCGAAVVDEAALCKQESLKRLKSRMRAKFMNRKRQILFPTTPEGITWFAEMFDSDANEGWHEIDDADAIQRVEINTDTGIKYINRRRIRLSTYMNQYFLPDDFIANLMNSYDNNSNYIDSYIHGYFRPFATGLAYHTYSAEKHAHENVDPDPIKPIHLTWDFNIEPAWVSFQEHKSYGQKAYKYYLGIHNADQGHDFLEDAVIEFIMKHPRKIFSNTPIYIYGDPTGRSRHHRTKVADFDLIKSTLLRAGYRKVVIAAIKSSPLERTSVEHTNRFLSEMKLQFCKRCKAVHRSANKTTWKDGKKIKLDKPQDDDWSHPMDAVKYFICGLVESSRQIMRGNR